MKKTKILDIYKIRFENKKNIYIKDFLNVILLFFNFN